MKTIYLIMHWDNGEKHPTGVAFEEEGQAKEHCKGSDGWAEYEEIELHEKRMPDCICDAVGGFNRYCKLHNPGPSPF